MKKQLILLQILGWTIAFVLYYTYLSSRLDDQLYVFAICVSAFISFIVIIYGYAFLLHPRYYKRIHLSGFIALVSFYFILVVGVRFLIERLILFPLRDHSGIFDLGTSHLLYDLFSSFFALVVGILLFSVMQNVATQKRELELKRKQSEAELNQLKAQLQPHFLFNSFNNLYYDVYKTLPEVGERIIRLSEIMRYFMEHSIKERVSLNTELEFIVNYVELERIRHTQPSGVDLKIDVQQGILVPPMLLMPLIENIFKHGRKTGGVAERAEISITVENERLILTTKNSLPDQSNIQERSGIGLKNLQERLNLLYGRNFFLHNEFREDIYLAQLQIPLA